MIRCALLECREPFVPRYTHELYCSIECERQAYRARKRAPETSDQGPTRRLYAELCISCGRRSAETLLTDTEARYRALRGISRCTVCRGTCVLEQCLLAEGRSA